MNGIRIPLVITSGSFPRPVVRAHTDVENGSPNYFIGFGNFFKNSVPSCPSTSLESMSMGSPFEVRFRFTINFYLF